MESFHEYVVGMVAEQTFTVAKFGLRYWPVRVYTVGWYGSSHLTCSCPGGNHPTCKHRKMVAEYIEKGFPVMNCFWVNEKGQINGCYGSVTSALKEQIEGITDIHRPAKAKKAIRRKK